MDIKRILRAIGIFLALLTASLFLILLDNFIPIEDIGAIVILIIIFYWCYMIAER